MVQSPEHSYMFPGRGGLEEITSRLSGGSRGVSPTIGVVLMLAVTISIAVVIIPFVLSIAGDATDSAPQTDFSYSYSEGIANDITDDFGQDGGQAQGFVRIDVESGDSIRAEQLRINTTVSGGNLADTDIFDEGDRIHPGDTITVWAARGDQIDIIWTAADGGESATLERFTVGGVDNLIPPGAPDPEEDCDWVKDNIEDGNLVIVDVVVQCDLDEKGLESLTIEESGTLIGTANASDDVSIFGEQYGTVHAHDGTVAVEGFVSGDVTASEQVTVEGEAAEIDGVVQGGDDGVDVLDNAYVTGDVYTEASSLIRGDVTVGGNVIAIDQTDSPEDFEIMLDYAVIENHVFLEDDNAELLCYDEVEINGMSCEEYKAPELEITIDSTNEPIEDGETYTVETTVENVGMSDEDDQDIELRIDEEHIADTETVTLPPGEDTEVVLEWTDAGPPEEYDINVSGDDDYELRDLTVHEDAPATFQTSTVIIADIEDGDLNAARFQWELDKEDVVTLVVETEEEQTHEEQQGESDLSDYDPVEFPVTFWMSVEDGECWEIQVDDPDEDDEFDLIEEGWSC